MRVRFAPKEGVAISADRAHSATVDVLFTYVIWSLIGLIALGSGVAILVW